MTPKISPTVTERRFRKRHPPNPRIKKHLFGSEARAADTEDKQGSGACWSRRAPNAPIFTLKHTGSTGGKPSRRAVTHRAENTLTVSAAVGPGPPDINPASLSAAAAAVTPELVAEEATGSSGYLLPVHSGVQRTNRAVCRCQISKVAHEAEADVRKAPSGTPPELREARQLEKSEEPRRAESHRKSTRRKSRRCARSSEAAEHQTRR